MAVWEEEVQRKLKENEPMEAMKADPLFGLRTWSQKNIHDIRQVF